MFDKFFRLTVRWTRALRIEKKGIVLNGFNVLAHTGDSLCWYPALIIGIILVPEEQRSVVFSFLIGVLGVAILVSLLKYLFRKQRPEGNSGIMYRLFDPYAFPSGHAARAFLLATMSAFLFRWTVAVGVLIWAILVSISRIVCGLHDLADVLAGMVAGVVVGCLVSILMPFMG